MTEQESKSQMICGRSYTVSPPQKPQYPGRTKPKPRFLVEGITHKNGQLIRFKSLENAERHIRNLRLEKE